MFSSPALHVFSQENVRSVVKKPGTTDTIARKPLNDRTVNGTSPSRGKNLKSEPIKTSEPTDVAEIMTEDCFFYDTFSFRDVGDIYLIEGNFLSGNDVQKILDSYCNYRVATPPPKLSPKVDTFVKMPLDTNPFFKEDDFKLEYDEGFEDTPLPEIQWD